MCDMIEVFRADGRRMFCETKAELREAIGAEPTMEKDYATWNDGDCLCPCNLHETANAAGFELLHGEQMDYLMTEKYVTPNVELTGEGPQGRSPG